jgi:uncharacterized RDD family membrane protein YckC
VEEKKMSRIDRYLEEVTKNIYASPAEKESFVSDLRSHIDEAIENGEMDLTVLKRMGTPYDIAEEFMSNVKLENAGFFERLIAFAVDTSLYYSLVIPVMLIVVLGFDAGFQDFTYSLMYDLFRGVGINAEPVNITPMNIFFIVTFYISMIGAHILYFPLLESYFGKTLGKYLMGLRVINEKGGDVTLGAAFVRRLSYYLEILTIDSIFILFSKNKQRAFDMVAKTLVIREPHVQKSPLMILMIFGLLIIPFVIIAGTIILMIGIS